MRMRRWPSKWNGLVTTPTVRMPRSRAVLAITGAAPVPVPPPMPAVTKHHMRAGEMIADLVDHLFGGGAADIGLRAGAEAFGHLHAHLHDALGFRHRERLSVGIGDHEIDALQAGGDHIVDGIAAGAADTEHGNAGLKLTDVRDIQIDGHDCLLFVAPASSHAVLTAPSGPPPAAEIF